MDAHTPRVEGQQIRRCEPQDAALLVVHVVGHDKCFPVETEDYFYRVVRYVERNALRANLVERAESWHWSSLRRAEREDPAFPILSTWPLPRPDDWAKTVNQPQTEAELAALRCCVNRGRPFGDPNWATDTAKRLGLEWTLRPRGRPKKQAKSAESSHVLQIWWLSPYSPPLAACQPSLSCSGAVRTGEATIATRGDGATGSAVVRSLGSGNNGADVGLTGMSAGGASLGSGSVAGLSARSWNVLGGVPCG